MTGLADTGLTAPLALSALLVMTETVFTVLAVLNVRHAATMLDREREWITERLDVDPDRVLAYQRAYTLLGRLRAWTLVAVVLAVVLGGGLAWWAGVAGTLVTAVGAASDGLLAGVLFVLGLVVAAVVLRVPFDGVETFVIEERFGFNNQSPTLFVRDKLVGVVLTVVLAVPLAAGVLWLVGRPLWPLAATTLFVGVSLLLQVVYPRVIAPLFNDFEPVTDDVRAAVTEVFDRAGFETDGIYRMDASRRSAKVNAYFVGFGRTKRVVLFDTLIEAATREETQSVLAHELAHWRFNHVWQRLAAGAVRVAVVLTAVAWLMGTDLVAIGASSAVEHARLAVALVWLWPLSRLTAPLDNRLALAHERAADDYAAEVMGSGTPLASALARLGSENLSNPFPHPAYAAFHHDHPPIPERMRRLRETDVTSSGDAGPDPDGTAAD